MTVCPLQRDLAQCAVIGIVNILGMMVMACVDLECSIIIILYN